jgi:hypothetical protein
MFGWPRPEVNFDDVESLREAEFLFPLVRMVTNEHEKENRHSFLQIRAHETDEEAMGKIFL